jgi:hypothetical protein
MQLRVSGWPSLKTSVVDKNWKLSCRHTYVRFMSTHCQCWRHNKTCHSLTRCVWIIHQFTETKHFLCPIRMAQCKHNPSHAQTIPPKHTRTPVTLHETIALYISLKSLPVSYSRSGSGIITDAQQTLQVIIFAQTALHVENILFNRESITTQCTT